MNKIESDMVSAIWNNRNWRSGNTVVETDKANISRVFLNGNHIATVDYDTLMIMDGGKMTKTTMTRLNAMIAFFRHKGEYVFRRDMKWYVRKCYGEIDGHNLHRIDDFHSGYTFVGDIK